MRGRIVRADGKINLVITFGLGHLLLFGFQARQRVKDGGIGRSELLCGMQRFVGFGEFTKLGRLKAKIKLKVGRVGELFAGMAQGSKRSVRAVVPAAAAVDPFAATDCRF